MWYEADKYKYLDLSKPIIAEYKPTGLKFLLITISVSKIMAMYAWVNLRSGNCEKESYQPTIKDALEYMNSDFTFYNTNLANLGK